MRDVQRPSRTATPEEHACRPSWLRRMGERIAEARLGLHAACTELSWCQQGWCVARGWSPPRGFLPRER